MNFIVDGVKAQKKWAPILDALKVVDDEKRHGCPNMQKCIK
jgi:hypothetical protein